jgi:hypothetical protein
MSDEPDRQAGQRADWVRWRRRQAVKAGLSRVEANLYAESEIPSENLRRLVERDCPKKLLAKILL